MPVVSGNSPIDQFDTANFDDPMPLTNLEPGRLCIQHYLSHARIFLSIAAFAS